MVVEFVKMHGCGNDYIHIDCIQHAPPENPSELAVQMCHRHFGIGGDGLILIKPGSNGTDGEMEMYNVDGSLAEMCGNGLRCVAKYLYDTDMAKKTKLRILTGAGVLDADIVEAAEGRAREICLDMGAPILKGLDIPTVWDLDTVVNHPLDVDGQTFEITAVSMGNPHCVIYVNDVEHFPVETLGPRIETDPRFPNRVNVEFVQVVSEDEVIQRTWERGSGETWACGTGASAVCVAGVLTGKTHRKLLVHLRGGDLKLHYREDGPVMLTGPAEDVFKGVWGA